MATVESLITAEKLLKTPDLGRCELLQGELITMSPSGALHGRYVDILERWIGSYVAAHSLGVTFGAETGFIIERNPDTVRAPDVALVVQERIPNPFPTGFFPGPPDLAVEVLSPGDRASEVTAKTRHWLATGCREVWNVDPETKTITLHRADGSIVQLSTSDHLESPQLLPGLRKPLAEIFQEVGGV
jgi:Uma2 family endonuclease